MLGWSALALAVGTAASAYAATTTPAPTHTGVWTSGLPTTTVVITTAKVGGRCNYAAFGTRTVCAPTQSCKSRRPGTSTCTQTTSIVTSTKTTSPAPTGTSTGNWLKPVPGDKFLWSLERDIPASPVSNTGLAVDANIYDVDLFGTSAEKIAEYKKRGKKVVCYFSAGSWESYRPDAGDFTPACYCNKGSKCKMEEWPEYWLDLNTPSCVSNIQSIMAKRIALAKSKGCDAVEPDNTDSYLNNPGWSTTIDNQFSYLQFLSTTAHDAGLGIALKNGPDMIAKKPKIVDITDFVLIEECSAYNECGAYKAFVDAGKAAFEVEYERSIDCSKILKGFFAMAYSSYSVDYRYITKICAN